MKKDLNNIAALEKAIAEKYGDEAAINPKSLWNPAKELEYLKQSKESQIKEAKLENTQEKIDLNGFLITKKLINRNIQRECTFCNTYSFSREDDVYITKFETCFKCYVKYVEGKENKWKNGWRPNLEHKNGT